MKEKIMRMAVALLVMLSFVHVACAAEKIVQLTVPGCLS